MKRVKDEGISVAQAAKEHGVSEGTIYAWLGRGVKGLPTLGELGRLKRQNEELLNLRGGTHPREVSHPKKELIRKQKETKAALARILGISRSSLYYISKKLPEDWALKNRIEGVLSLHPGYGYRRVAIALGLNRKRIQRVMRLFGMKAYRRRGRKPKKHGAAGGSYPNLLKEHVPQGLDDVWVADFTYIPYFGKFLYMATVMDIFGKNIVGLAVMMNHGVSLVLQALFSALTHHPRPTIFHSDNGREYGSRIFTRALTDLGIRISRSAKASPWENGYQESFYSQFKVDLGDPERFKTLGELVYEIYRLVWEYNHTRIHSALRMPPLLFAERHRKLSENVSQNRGS